MEDAKPAVRQAAAESMAKVAGKGDVGAIAAVSARLEDADGYVRLAAVEALAKIALKGDGGMKL